MSGPNSSSEWSIEGRRLVPLMPRLVPQTAFTVTANAVANATANQNASLLLPAETGNKEGQTDLNFFGFLKMLEAKLFVKLPPYSGCMLFLHKHHLYLHQRYSDQRRGHRSNCEIPTTNQSFIQCGSAAQWEHRLRKK